MKAKMKLTRLWSFLLALVMVVGMLPAMSLTAYATETTHSVYVYDKDTGKKYAFNYYDETYYYTVGNDRPGTLEENPDWNVHFDRRNAVLELRNYNGGRIEARYTNWAYEENYLTIKLIGNNTITNSSNYPGLLSNQEYLDITTEEYDNATLTINNTNYYVGIQAEDLVIGSYADVTVNVPMLPDDNCACAAGIWVSGEFALVGASASCTVNITNESGAEDYAYGIQADSIKLSTGGNLYIDVSQAGTYSYGIVSKSLNDTNRHVNYATIKYKKDSNGRGSALLPENLFDIFATSSSYAVNINDDKGIATYRYGAPVRTVTVTNGTCDASGKSTGEFFAGDTVWVTANEAPEGYQLKGWTSDDVTLPSGSILNISFKMPDEDVAVSAEYDLRPLTVTFQTWNITEAPKKQIVKYGEKAKKPTDPVSDYYTFAGWYKDDEYTIPFDIKNTPITEDITLYAKWLDGTFHKVTFANGNTAPSTTSELPEAQLVADGQLAAKPEPDPTAEGWIFGGWHKSPNGGSPFDFATETITEDITLYADWADPYYVYFNANGGTGTMDPVAVYPGDWCTIPECGFTAPVGKQFKGWAFNANSTDVVQFTSFEVSGGDKTLYAIWGDITYIDSVDVTIPVPVQGESPQKAVSNTEGVTVTLTTWNSPSFEAGKVYTVIVCVSVDSGYTFADNVTLTFNGSKEGIPAGSGNGKLIYFAEFTAAASAGYTVSGTATSFGSDTDNVILQLIAEGYSEADYEVFVKGNTASYTIEGVAPGTYTMKVMKNNHVAREYTVTVSTENVTQDVEIWLLGDVNGDGTINVKDKKLIFNHLNDPSGALTGYALDVGDVNRDGTINVKDKKLIFNHLKGISLWS